MRLYVLHYSLLLQALTLLYVLYQFPTLLKL